MNWQNAVQGGSGDSADTVLLCTDGGVLCPSGQCAKNMHECEITMACPWDLPYRCWNGECVADATAGADFACPTEVDCPQLPADPAFPDWPDQKRAYRCEDGSCRRECFQFDGCPIKMFHCANRECAKTSDECKAAETFDESIALIPSIGRRLLEDTTGFKQPGFDNLTTPHACFDGCRSQTKAIFSETVIDPAITTEISFAVGVDHIVSGKIIIPSGSLISNSGKDVPKMTIYGVGDSYMRNFVNRVTASRRAEHGKYLTYPNSLLSPAFVCSVNDDTHEPFAIPITVVASIDLDKKPKDPAVPFFQDVCLAYMYKIPDVEFRAWKCVEKGDAGRMAAPVRSVATNQTEALHVVKGNIVGCQGSKGVLYGFAFVPLRAPAGFEEDTVRWWADNLIWIVLVFCAVGGIMAGVFYVFKRLHRYRKKYKETDKQVKEMSQEVDEMEQFGGSAGQKDEAMEMMSNPMVVQMKDMQAKLDRKNKEVVQEEEKQRQQESEARQEHITKLQDDRDKLAEELERLKKELTSAPQREVETAKPVSPDTRGPKRQGSGRSKDTAVRAQFDAKPPAPRRKKKEVD